MTQGEFAQGWKLLILQPWGWRYRQLTPEGQPTEEARLQMQFYFDKLKWATAGAWMKTVQQHAAGEDWPTLTSLTTSLRAMNADFIRAIPAPKDKYITKEEFGLDLFECIKLFSQRNLCREHYKRMVTNLDLTPEGRKVKLDALTTQDGELSQAIVDLISKINPADAKRLLEKYETKGAA